MRENLGRVGNANSKGKWGPMGGKSQCLVPQYRGSIKYMLFFVLYIPGEFWNALGGKKEYQTSAGLLTELEDHPPRLYGCSNKTGRFIVCLRLSALFLVDLVILHVLIHSGCLKGYSKKYPFLGSIKSQGRGFIAALNLDSYCLVTRSRWVALLSLKY